MAEGQPVSLPFRIREDNVRTTLLLTLALTACGGPAPMATWTADNNPDLEETGSQAVLVVPNLDDDDQDGTPDWEQRGAPNDDDFATITVQNKARDTTITLADHNDLVRVWHEQRVVLGEGAPPIWQLPERKRNEEIELRIEVAGWGHLADLQIIDDRKEVAFEVAIVGAEPTLAHHLLPTERVWVMTVNERGYSNASMVADLTSGLGDTLHLLQAWTYDYDVWVQDEPEFTRAWSPDSEHTFILNSIRNGNGNGGLTEFPPTLVEPDVFEDTIGDGFVPTTFDAFGNLETSPPVEVDGEPYPLGRIYYGWDGRTEGNGPVSPIRDHLQSITTQAPFWVDTSWLCVAHIDEVVSFLPDPTAPRGFRFLISDTDLGFQAIESVPASTALTNHGRTGYSGHGRPTAGSYANDAALRAYNQDLQRDHLDPMLEVFKRELALLDDEIVPVPAYFEDIADFGQSCGAAAVVPGMVNLLMETDSSGEGGRAWIADPFFRPPGAPHGDDPFINMWNDLMPASVEPIYVDNWEVYHMGLGEVHCGTNQERVPALATVPDLNAWLQEVIR